MTFHGHLKTTYTMEFFIYKNNKQQGPYTTEQLAGMDLASETLVWREGMEQWTPAWQVAELKDILNGKAQAGPVPPPVPPADGPQPEGGQPHDEPGGQPSAPETATAQPTEKRHRRAVTWLAVAAVLFFALLMTCPDEAKHREAVSREVMEVVRDGMGTPDTGNGTIDLLGGMFGQAIASRLVDAVVGQFMEVDNYLIFSVGTLHYDGKSKAVSFGVLGHVFTFDANDIRKAVDKDSPLPGTMAI